MSKTNKNSKLKYILQDTWPALLRIVKIPRNKERLRNCHRPEENKGDVKTNYGDITTTYSVWYLRSQNPD